MAIESVLTAPPRSDQFRLRDPAMTLRPVCTDDEPFLTFLNAQERGVAYAGLRLPEALLTKMLATHLRAQTEGYLAQYRGAERLVVCRDGEPIGRLWLSFETGASGGCLRLIDLVLREEVRGAGIGSDLLCSLVDSARAMRLARVTLSIFAGNEGAIRLCKKIGFRLQGTTDETAHFSMIYTLS